MLNDGGNEEAALYVFLDSAMSKYNFLRKNKKCNRQLSEKHLQKSSYKLVKAQKAWIKITEQSKCELCNKLLYLYRYIRVNRNSEYNFLSYIIFFLVHYIFFKK